MFKIGETVMFSAEDIRKSLHTSKETAYSILKSKGANAKMIGRKLLISEDNLRKILNNENV